MKKFTLLVTFATLIYYDEEIVFPSLFGKQPGSCRQTFASFVDRSHYTDFQFGCSHCVPRVKRNAVFDLAG